MKGKHHVKTETEIGVMYLSAKESQELVATTWSEEWGRKDSIRSLRESTALLIPWFLTPRLQSYLRWCISTVLSDPVGGALWWQPWEMNTIPFPSSSFCGSLFPHHMKFNSLVWLILPLEMNLPLFHHNVFQTPTHTDLSLLQSPATHVSNKISFYYTKGV